MTARQSQLGLGLGLPHSGSLYNHSSGSTDPYHGGNPLGSTATDGKPLSCSVDTDTRTIMGSHMIDVAATVVGTIPEENQLDRAPRPQARNDSDDAVRTLKDVDLEDESVAHLKLTRCRVRSEPVPSISGEEGHSGASAPIPRADSLLHLGSETVSTDLKKLLNVRVRQALPNIDTSKANASRISSAASSPTKDGARSSRLETEKSRPRIEVYFALNNHVAIEGGCIAGSLTVRTRKPRRGEARHVRIDNGKIRVLGYEGISESERYAFYQCTASLEDAAADHEQLYESLPDSEGFRVAREGTFTLTFKMHIPQPATSQPGKNIPKGVIQDDSISASIKYILLISFKVRDDPDNAAGLDKHASLANSKTSIAHFYRHVEIWPTYGPLALHSSEEVRPIVDHSGTVSSRAARELFFGGSGMLHLTAVLHRKVWLAGQKCTVYIGAWNETRKFVKTLTLAIIRKAIIARPNQNESINRKQIAEVTLDAVRGPTFGTVTTKGWWAGIEPGSSCELSHMIDIPIDALTVSRTHVIEISYVLRVSLVTGSLSPNVFVDLPFVVINALSTDGLPVPPPPGLLTGSLKLPKDTPVLFSFKPPRTQDNKNLDLRTWSFPRTSPQETSLLPRDYILDWTKQTAHADPSPIKSDFTQGSDSLPVRSRGSPRLDDTSTTLESVSNFITQLESDLDSVGHAVGADKERRSVRFAHQSNERGSEVSGILKAPSSAKHQRLRGLILGATQSRTFDSYSASREPTDTTLAHHSDIGADSALQKLPPVKKLRPRDNDPVLVIPDNDIWSSDDADAILGSINLDNQVFSAYDRSDFDHTQEIIVDRPPPGVNTASTLSSEPWSSEATSTGYQSSTDQRSSRFAAPSPNDGRPPSLLRRQEISSAPASRYSYGQRSEPFFAEDTPRAGSIRKFQPEIVTGTAQMSASRATLVPAISSPMLAKSQSAYVIGSPVNQYRRFVPQSFGVPLREEGPTTTHGSPQMTVKEKRKLNAGRTPWKTQWDQGATSVSRESTGTGSQSSIENDIRTSRIHLRTRSTPQPREEQNRDATLSQSTVRSRIAALEERSRGRPYSSYA
ncbi:Putative cyclic nucleotide-gated ion channel 19 [Rhizoctonia solani]|uniref:Putative cyclic nucleotide-gated ion channel 19 n=1 Tax=Rhizoctonia solani TaxID=456999 RepID=A0A0K6FN30_9AGAM|nr:Putative cyclic nucleotide-gated ion channel 19 [Rhizoctonia solani]